MPEHSRLTRELIEAGLRPKARRTYGHGPIRLMAAAEGYVMVRRPGATPFVLPQAEWLALEEAA